MTALIERQAQGNGRMDAREAMNGRIVQAGALVRKNGAGIAVEIAINFALPYLIYGWAEPSLGRPGR